MPGRMDDWRQRLGFVTDRSAVAGGLRVELAPEVPIEATAIETDSLDDDAFFASLREAVRDDAPLGPRDEDQESFFDGSSEQDRRRFRRRR